MTNLESGSYTIDVAFAGYPPQSQRVTMESGNFQGVGFGLGSAIETSGCAAGDAGTTPYQGDLIILGGFVALIWRWKRERVWKGQ